VAREAAAGSFLDSGLPGEAAAERLAAAANLQSTGSMSVALELIAQARIEAERAQRVDLQARILGLEGLVRARLGDVEAGLELAREGFSLALAENLVGSVAEIHDRLGLILENSSDYGGALEAWRDAYAFCELHGISDRAYVCLSCVGYVMRKTGDWNKAAAIFRGLITSDGTPRSARSAAAFTRLPLWPSATVRTRPWWRRGCAFAHALPPVVEYRVWPIAYSPRSAERLRSSKT